MSGPFYTTAYELVTLGIAPLPLGGEDGKRPLVSGFDRWTSPPSLRTVAKWTTRFGGCNVGIACGASSLVVADYDDPFQIEHLASKLPASPVVVHTAGGGQHHYYRNVDHLGCFNLRDKGIRADLKGVGGIVVCPPSVNPQTGKRYHFKSGDFSLFHGLPALTRCDVAHLGVHTETTGAGNPVGTRNASLFDHLRYLAPWTDLDSIVEEARWFNSTQNAIPESDEKVVATARSVLKYQERGSLRAPFDDYVRLPHSALDRLKTAGKDYPAALAMFVGLQRNHGSRSARGEIFAIATEPMAEAEVIPGIRDRRRYDRARHELLQSQLIIQVRPSLRLSSGRFLPGLYRLRR